LNVERPMVAKVRGGSGRGQKIGKKVIQKPNDKKKPRPKIVSRPAQSRKIILRGKRKQKIQLREKKKEQGPKGGYPGGGPRSQPRGGNPAIKRKHNRI